MEDENKSTRKFSLIETLAKISGMNSDIIESGINKSIILNRAAIGALLLVSTTLVAAGIANFIRIPFPDSTVIPLIVFIAVAIGFFWFDLSFICSIDQMRDKSARKLVTAFGIRLMILLPFSILSSNGILLRIYDQEIKNQITFNRLENDRETRKEVAKQIDSLNLVKSNINTSFTEAFGSFETSMSTKEALILEKKSRLQKKSDLLVQEIEGKLKRPAGYGDAAKAKEAQIALEKLELEKLEKELFDEKMNGSGKKVLDQKEAQLKSELSIIDNLIAELDGVKKEQLNTNKETATLGFQDQFLALQQIRNDGKSSFIMNVLLLALIFFELIPLLVKLFQAMNGTTEYERMLHMNLKNEEMESRIIENDKFKHILEKEKVSDQETKKREFDHHQKIMQMESERQGKENERLAFLIDQLSEYQKNLKKIDEFKKDKNMRKTLKKLKIV